MRRCVRWGGAAMVVAALAVGCTRTPPAAKAASDEEQVRAQFVALQDALTAALAKPNEADTRKIWDLLHGDSQEDANRIAKAVSDQYAKADAPTKAKMEEALRVPGPKMGKYSGVNYLRGKEFLGKWDEIPGSKIDKITFEKDKAWVHYVEKDGDAEKLPLARQDERWKFILPIPRFELK